MDCRHVRRRSGYFRLSAAPSAGLLFAAVAGCAASFPFAHNEFGPGFPKDASVEEIVGQLNSKIEQVKSWQASDVRISGPTLPVHLTGRIAVERPRNFRLTATALGMDEADFGSNHERFWFWIKHGQPTGSPNYVYQAKHEDIEQSDLLRQIPFQPDWLMEALGVVPLDPKSMTLHPGESGDVVNLIAERLSPSGEPVKRVVRVDTRHRWILGHSLYDARGNLIASAHLENHNIDKSGVVMPHLITLEWPKAGMKISLEIGHIDVNPRSFPRRIWDVPARPYSPAYDIGARTRRTIAPAGMTVPAPAKTDAAKTPPGFEEQSPAAGDRTESAQNVPRAKGTRPVASADDLQEWSKPIEESGSARGSADGSVGAPPDLGPRAGSASLDSRPGTSGGASGQNPFEFDDVPAKAGPAQRAPQSPDEPVEVSPH